MPARALLAALALLTAPIVQTERLDILWQFGAGG
jgi:hypothetical protein